MKRYIALILAAAVAVCWTITSCSNDRSIESTEETEETTRRIREPLEPQHDLSNVDTTMEFDDFYVEYEGDPWVLRNNIPFTTGNVNTYYSQYLVNNVNGRYAEIESEQLNNVATIYMPRVRHYPADRDGYTIYEISYQEVFPHRITIPNQYFSDGTFWSYHEVGFLDYYTGNEYPTISMSADIDSFKVYGNVIYNGQTYEVEYYEFREDEHQDSNVVEEDGTYIWEDTVIINSTVYFIVPNGYDGIVMYIYIADDSDQPFEEAIGGNEPEFSDATVFGSPGNDEDLEDYAFISIAELG